MLMAIALVVVFGFKALVGLALTLFQTRFSFSVAHRLSGIMWTYHFSQNLEQSEGRATRAEFSQKSMVGRDILPIIHGGVIAVDYRIFRGGGHMCMGLLRARRLVSVAYWWGRDLLIRKLTDARLRAYGQIQKEKGPSNQRDGDQRHSGILEVITFRAVEPVRNEYSEHDQIALQGSSNSSVITPCLPRHMKCWP